jgi:hypothetical protein
MSFELLSAVRNDRTVKNPYDRFILFLLADHANESTGKCFPSLNTLAEESGMDRRSVMRCLKRVEQHGMIKREPGGGKGNPSTNYVFPGLQGSPPDGLPEAKGRDPMPLLNGDGRDRMPLPSDTRGSLNGSRANLVESAESAKGRGTGAQGRDCVPLEVGTVVHKVGAQGPPNQKKQKLNPKEASAAAKESSASAVAASESFALLLANAGALVHADVTVQWVQSLQPANPDKDVLEIAIKCVRKCIEKNDPVTQARIQAWVKREFSRTQETQSEKKPEKPDKLKRVNAPKMLDINILAGAINENILGSLAPGIKSCSSGKELLKYLKKQLPGVDPLSLLHTAKERRFWEQCGFVKFYRLPEKEKDIQKLDVREIVIEMESEQ